MSPVVHEARAYAPSRPPPRRVSLSALPLSRAGDTAVTQMLADPKARGVFEGSFNQDFSSVRVSSDPQAARAHNARAFTRGERIVLGDRPSFGLLAHELAHVIQQRVGGGPAGPAHEVEANAAARNFESGGRVNVALGSARGGVQRAGTVVEPTPPSWLNGLNVRHITGGIWEVEFNTGGWHMVGPYRELDKYRRSIGVVGDSHHIVGGEHLLDLNSTFSYNNAPAVVLEKGLHERVITPRIGHEQTAEGGRSGGRPVLTQADVKRMYRGAYTEQAPFKELSQIANNIVDQSTPAPAIAERKAEPAPGKRPTAEPDYLQNRRPATSGSELKPIRSRRSTAERVSAHSARPEPTPGKKSGLTAPELAEMPVGRPGSVEVIGHAVAGVQGALMSQAMMRLNDVGRQYPKDADMSWTVENIKAVLDTDSFLKDPKSFVAGKITERVLEAIFSHYSAKLQAIKQSFEKRFPSISQIQNDPIGTGLSLKSYQTDYEAARARLRAPAALRALMYVAVLAHKGESPEGVQQRLREVDEAIAKASDSSDDFQKYKWQSTRFQFVIFLFAGRIEQLSAEYADLSAGMVGDLSTRAEAVRGAAGVFRDTSKSMWERGLVIFSPMLMLALDLEHAADRLDTIGDQFDFFASAVDGRRAEYDREIQRVRAESRNIADQPLFVR